jgi:hypothetical protein
MRLLIVFLFRSLVFLVFPVLAFAQDRVVLQTGNEIGAIAPGYEADFVGVAGDIARCAMCSS